MSRQSRNIPVHLVYGNVKHTDKLPFPMKTLSSLFPSRTIAETVGRPVRETELVLELRNGLELSTGMRFETVSRAGILPPVVTVGVALRRRSAFVSEDVRKAGLIQSGASVHLRD